jgi:hypothetical protein
MQLKYHPLRSVDKFHVFMVGPDWPASGQIFVGVMPCGELSFDIPPRNFTVPEIPQPLEANFKNEIGLLGYDLPTRRIQPGERLPLTLYWRALAYVGEDYHIFANPLDVDQQRWGGYDRRPRDGYSTLQWVPGEVIIDPFGVPIAPDAPDGVYNIDFGFYRATGAGAESLSLFQNGQSLGQYSLRLGPIKIGGPPAGIITTSAAPQVSLNYSLGNQITLLGYDLTDPDNQPIPTLSEVEGSTPQSFLPSFPSPLSALHLTLYWQAETIPATDYTTFLHLRNDANDNVTQKDQPPANGRYPTSLWDVGEIIVDKIILPLEGIPSGEYTPVIGLYDFTTGARLPILDSLENELRLESVILP